MAMTDVDGSCQLLADSQLSLVGLVWGLAATWCSVCICQVNYRSGISHDDSMINVVIIIILQVSPYRCVPKLLMTCCRSLSCVPPSQNAHASIPHIAPDSPTDISGQSCDSN